MTSTDGQILDILAGQIGLDPDAARIFLFVTTRGRSSVGQISSELDMDVQRVRSACLAVEDLGGFICMSDDDFEAMHPRFTAVNMYRRSCQRRDIPFKRNNAVDSIGALLEERYTDARTK